METNLLLHPSTQASVTSFIKHPAHAVLILGHAGAGKSTLANDLSGKILQTSDISNHPYVKLLDASEGEGIAQVREIRKFLGLKTTGSNRIRRVVIVENVDHLGGDAQNALLKTLEEPPQDSVIILTASQKGLVLDTILSRVHLLKILPLTEEVCLGYKGFSVEELKKAYALSGGLAGSFLALLDSGNDHPIVSSVETAKTFLAQSTLERLSSIETYSKDRDQARQLLSGLEMCLHAALKNAKQSSLQTLHQKLEFTVKARQSLEHSVNTKLLLTTLSVNL